jgi:hypothetical protein
MGFVISHKPPAFSWRSLTSVHENRAPEGKVGFVAFGYLDALTRRGFCDLAIAEPALNREDCQN